MPVTAVLGPRQCGKTTLVKMIIDQNPDNIYLDLERPDDLRALSDPQTFFRLHRGKLLCLDEIQRVPELFPVIRAEVDEANVNNRFLILGSASPDLLRQTSESLAGRIRYIELTPFLMEELDSDEATLRKLWLRGGFPRSYLSDSDDESYEWRLDFIKTFLDRDIPSMGFRIPGNNMRRFWTMLTHLNGQVLNRSKLGESIGVSHHTVQHHLDILADSFMIRILQPLEINVRKRIVKSPKIYFRDTGILHALQGIISQKQLMSHPGYGSSWESFALENICSNPSLSRSWQFYFYSTHSGGEIDLVLDNGQSKIAVEFKASGAPEISSKFIATMGEVGVTSAWVVAPVNQMYSLRENITVGSIENFFETMC